MTNASVVLRAAPSPPGALSELLVLSACDKPTADLDDHRREGTRSTPKHLLQRRRCGEDRRPDEVPEGLHSISVDPDEPCASGVDPKIADNGWTNPDERSAADRLQQEDVRTIPGSVFFNTQYVGVAVQTLTTGR